MEIVLYIALYLLLFTLCWKLESRIDKLEREVELLDSKIHRMYDVLTDVYVEIDKINDQLKFKERNITY